MKNLLTAIVCALVLAACSSSQVKPEDTTTSTPPATTTTTPPSTSTAGAGTTTPSGSTVGVDPLRDPNSPLSKRSIYFDFDSNVVKPEYQGTLQAHARYLQTNPSRKIRIEGHTDERGSREYNLALGSRRADAVKRVLTVMGVAESRIETTSYGEEKPKALGHDEASWAENRRADIAYDGE